MLSPGQWTKLGVLLWFVANPTVVRAQSPQGASRDAEEWLGEEGELRRAISLYDSGQYGSCVDAFERLLDVEAAQRIRSPSKVESAQVYYGSCLIGVGRTLEAEVVFRKAILENPQMKTPDSLLFPEAVVDLFLRVRESLMDDIRRAERKRMQEAEDRANREIELRQREQARVTQLMRLAESETVIVRHSRWLTLVPYGTGQFQNGAGGLGWFFLGSEALLSTAFFSSLYLTSWYGSKTDDKGITSEQRAELGRSQRDAYWVSAITGWGLVGFIAAGIVEANFSFVPETRVERPRKLPGELRNLGRRTPRVPSVALSVVPLQHGDWMGSVVAQF